MARRMDSARLSRLRKLLAVQGSQARIAGAELSGLQSELLRLSNAAREAISIISEGLTDQVVPPGLVATRLRAGAIAHAAASCHAELSAARLLQSRQRETLLGRRIAKGDAEQRRREQALGLEDIIAAQVRKSAASQGR